jgi:hypothetical protein
MVGVLALVVTQTRNQEAIAAAVSAGAVKDFDSVVAIAERVRDVIANGADELVDGSTWSLYRAVAQAYDIVANRNAGSSLATIGEAAAATIRHLMNEMNIQEAEDGRLILP